ncbi:MAG: tetratricopeptide repeat protein [Deltaproteobacteria bacterium]|nr:tetratricopeptide repeat protein [Deltaproteobacteria bacterium]
MRLSSCLPPALASAVALFFTACAPAVNLPGVHEPLDSEEWKRCAGELEERESISLIDDLTLDSKTLLCRGVVRAADGKVTEGLDLLTEATVLDKEDHRPHYLMGRILTEAGRYEEALAAFERSQQRFPEMEVPTERLGRRVREKDGDEPAKTFLLKAKERELCPYGCMGLLAEVYHDTGDDEQAGKIFDQMVKSKPGEPAGYVGQASLANSKSDFMTESELLTKATKTAHFKDLSERQQADIHYAHAFSRYNARKYKGAAKSIERGLRIEKKADWYVLAGWIELKLDNPAMALTKFEKATDLDSKLAAAHAGQGDSLIALGRTNDAIESFEKAKKLDAKDAVIVLKLAHAKAVAGDIDAAAALVDEAAALDKEHLPPDLLKKVTTLIQQ